MRLKMGLAALCAASALCASGAHAATLIYSASGVVTGAINQDVDMRIDLPAGGYTHPTRVDPSVDAFRGTIMGPVETYTIVLTTDAPVSYFTELDYQQNDISFESVPGSNGWIDFGGGDMVGGNPLAPPVINGNTYTWTVSAQWSESTAGCAPGDWTDAAACERDGGPPTELFENPIRLEIDTYFLGDVGDTYSILAYADVPEPAEWSLMTLGVGLLGAALRSRRRPALLKA